MPEQVLEEKELSVEAYLQLFAEASSDYQLVKKSADKLSRIVVKRLQDQGGRIFEDTTFFEKSGVQYTIRTALD